MSISAGGCVSAAELGMVREEGGVGERMEGKVLAEVNRAMECGRTERRACPWGWLLRSSCENFFSLQVGAEAEGSGLGWNLDIGSGSGDLGHSEELLRVSVEGDPAWCPDGLHNDPEGGTQGQTQMKPDWPPSVIVEADGGLLGVPYIFPSLYIFVYISPCRQFCVK